MLKRILSLVVVLLICMSCVLPAFAVCGPSSKDIIYASLQFDTLRLDNGDAAGVVEEWPLNEASGVPYTYSSDYVFAYVRAHNEVNKNYQNLCGEFVFADATQITLSSSYVWFTDRVRFTLEALDNPADLLITGLSIEYFVNYIGTGYTNEYCVNREQVVYNSVDDSAWTNVRTLELGSFVEKAYRNSFGSFMFDSGISVRLLSDLKIIIQFQFLDEPDSSRRVYIDVSRDNIAKRNHVQTWITQSNLRIPDDEGFDVASWLVTAVGGFLDFEIVPGFSISGFLGIVVTLAVILWFVKIVN